MRRHILPGQVGELRQLLNDWDFLDVRDISIQDNEYDCLLGPLLTRLVTCDGAEEVRVHLWERIEGHLGLNTYEVDAARIADKVIGWWSKPHTGRSCRTLGGIDC